MAAPVVWPRSGAWIVRSKLDRRWNCRGQFSSSEWWNPPHQSWPPEALEAVRDLKVSQAEDVPADLSCITFAYPTAKLKRLFATSVLAVTEKRGAFHDLTDEGHLGLSAVNVDRDAGEVSFGKAGEVPVHRFPARQLGILQADGRYWYWSWTAEGKDWINPPVLESARRLHEFGIKHQIPELTFEMIALGLDQDRPWFNEAYVATVACAVCQADFYIHAQISGRPGLHEFWLVTAPGVLSRPPSVARRIGYILQEVIETWGPHCLGTHPRKIIGAHAVEKRCTVTECPDSQVDQDMPDARRIARRIRIEDLAGDHISVDFEESGDICRINFPPSPGLAADPEPRSWLGKLFGRRNPR